MNQELLKRTLKNRRIELTEQEKKDYYPKEPLFMLLFTSAALLFCLVMAKIKGETKVLIRLAKENQWKIILCNKQQFVADDICMRWRVRVTVIFGNPYMAYNSRCNPTRRWHASGGRNWDNREAIRRAIEKEWAIKNKN